MASPNASNWLWPKVSVSSIDPRIRNFQPTNEFNWSFFLKWPHLLEWKAIKEIVISWSPISSSTLALVPWLPHRKTPSQRRLAISYHPMLVACCKLWKYAINKVTLIKVPKDDVRKREFTHKVRFAHPEGLEGEIRIM